MKIAVVSHTPVDEIQKDNINSVSVGGPTSYCGLMAKSLSHSPDLITKIGKDFEYKNLLAQKGLIIQNNCVSDKPTTRFKIIIREEGRKLFLLSRCADITVDDVVTDTDAAIISPIINEVNTDVIAALSKRTNFVFVDPQGFVRKVRQEDGSCYLDNTTMDFSRLKVDAIKVDREEALALTGSSGIDALHKFRVKTVIMSAENKNLMLSNEHIYGIATERVNARDSTGAGDILAGAFTSAFLETKEAKWAFCYGVAAAVVALKKDKVGIEKIPNRREVEDYASILENGVSSQ